MRSQLSKVVPFENLIVMGILNGSMVLEVLEHSVSERLENLPGRYCSYEGVRFRWDPRKPAYKRVRDVEVFQFGASTDTWKPLNEAKDYKFLTNDFIANGGSVRFFFLARQLSSVRC